MVVKFFITFLALTSSKINIDHHEERHSCKMSAALQFMCLRALSGQKNRNVKNIKIQVATGEENDDVLLEDLLKALSPGHE